MGIFKEIKKYAFHVGQYLQTGLPVSADSRAKYHKKIANLNAKDRN